MAVLQGFVTLAGRFLDPLSLLIVVGGAVLVAAFRSTQSDIARAFAALRPLVRADPQAEAQAARVAVNGIAQLAQAKGLGSADRVRSHHDPRAERFLRRAANQLSDTPDPTQFAAWGERELADRTARHAAAQGFWRALADAAPGMGMIGTVIGLVQMFANMDDPARIGPGMALALLTTLYGLALANAVAGPIAARLERLSEAELAWQRDTLARLTAIARAEQGEGASGLRSVA